MMFLASGSVFAEPPAHPMVTLWQSQPAAVDPDPNFAAAQVVAVHEAWDYDNAHDAAVRLAQTISANHLAGYLTDENVTIYLHGFGYDHSICVLNDPACEDDLVTRFFVEEDDRLYGLSDDMVPDPPPAVPETPEDLFTDARAFRQPFLKNATTSAPLRAWMEDFVEAFGDEIRRLKLDDEDPLYNPEYPDPSGFTWAFDTEAWFALYGSKNSTYMLWYLYDSSSRGGSYPDIWNTWKVPGSAGWAPGSSFTAASGMTPAAMYAAERSNQYAALSTYLWPAALDNGTSGISKNDRADSDQNRQFMIWWYNILAKAQDAIMEHCAYSVIRAEFPGSKCCNWEAARYDGQVDSTGWYTDLGTFSTTYPGVDASNELPRSWVDRMPSDALFRKENVLGPKHRRWIGLNEWASGDFDAPYLYPLSLTQLDGWGGANMGHRQKALYRNPSSDETDHEATLRLDRHTVESIINSYSGGHQDRLRPWLPQYLPDGRDPIIYYGNENAMRGTMLMLRAKRTKYLQMWTAGPTPCTQEDAWKHTLDIVRRVWSPAVVDIKLYLGDVPPTSPEHEYDMLEDTLPRTGDPEFTADIKSEQLPTSNLVKQGTAVQVVIGGITDDTITEPTCNETWQCWHVQYYDLVIECAAEEGVVGSVYVWDNSEGKWYTNPAWDYEFYTQDFSTRRTFVINRAWGDFLYEGEMLVKLVHLRPGTTPFTSKYDLVQMVPWYGFCEALEEEPEGFRTPAADMTYDHAVGLEDADAFVNALLLEKPSADLNMDGEIDGDDLAAFEASYVANAP